MDNLIALAILHSGGFTHNDLKKIFENEQNYSNVLEDFLHEKKTITPWMTVDRRVKILEKLSKVDASVIKNKIQDKNIQIIPIESDIYPEKLRVIKQAPYLLYVRGDLREERKMLGVVGSRRSTSYGKKILEKIIPELVHANCGIVSGGAHGIDAISHSISLESGGYTISVFGCGVDIFYPIENSRLFEDIIAK
jgi:DNA processing protein